MSPFSSPSSDGVESHDGTPGTKLTELSPEDVRFDSKAITEVSTASAYPPVFALPGHQVCGTLGFDALSLATHGSNDPFSASSGLPKASYQAKLPKLSPTAESFRPRLSSTSNLEQANSVGPGAVETKLCGVQTPIKTAVGYLRATSVPDSEASSTKTSSGLLVADGGTLLPPIGAPSSAPSSCMQSVEDCSSEKFQASLIHMGTRYVKITGVAKAATIDDLNLIFNVLAPSSALNQYGD